MPMGAMIGHQVLIEVHPGRWLVSMSWKGMVLVLSVASLLVISAPSAQARSVDVQLKDTLSFEPRQIVVQPGEALSLNLINDGVDDHTFTLFAEPDLKVPLIDFAALLEFNATNRKIVDVLVRPGKSIVVEFSAPRDLGSYFYVCMIPGHAAGGMHGLLVVGSPPAGGLSPTTLGIIIVSVMVTVTGIVLYLLKRE